MNKILHQEKLIEEYGPVPGRLLQVFWNLAQIAAGRGLSLPSPNFDVSIDEGDVDWELSWFDTRNKRVVLFSLEDDCLWLHCVEGDDAFWIDDPSWSDAEKAILAVAGRQPPTKWWEAA